MDGEQLNGSLENMTEDQAIAALKARREELERQAEANIESRLTVELQQDTIGRLSRMDALQQQAMAQATDRRRVTEISRVKAALERLKSGEWGYCVNCGEEISGKRLTNDPSVPHCLKCAEGQI